MCEQSDNKEDRMPSKLSEDSRTRNNWEEINGMRDKESPQQ